MKFLYSLILVFLMVYVGIVSASSDSERLDCLEIVDGKFIDKVCTITHIEDSAIFAIKGDLKLLDSITVSNLKEAKEKGVVNVISKDNIVPSSIFPPMRSLCIKVTFANGYFVVEEKSGFYYFLLIIMLLALFGSYISGISGRDKLNSIAICVGLVAGGLAGLITGTAAAGAVVGGLTASLPTFLLKFKGVNINIRETNIFPVVLVGFFSGGIIGKYGLMHIVLLEWLLFCAILMSVQTFAIIKNKKS